MVETSDDGPLVEARIDVVLEVDDCSFTHEFGTERDERIELSVDSVDRISLEEAEAWVEKNYNKLVKEFLEE